jgi:hypothetical protein
MWLTAALETAYGMELPPGRTPACEEMFTTQPAPFARRCGTAAVMVCQTPMTLTS